MRLIDADALMADVKKHAESYFAEDFAREWAERQPTVDAVPVVRCKDCINWQREWEARNGGHFCDMVDLTTSEDWYCADGERRDSE